MFYLFIEDEYEEELDVDVPMNFDFLACQKCQNLFLLVVCCRLPNFLFLKFQHVEKNIQWEKKESK